MISRTTISRIFEAVRIEEVIGEFVTLRRSGKDMKAPCPFHNEKTPSFFVSPVKGIYKCFGCGKAGNAVTFLMEHEKYTFPEALKFLARKYNIAIEETIPTEEEKAKETESESIYLVNAYAQRFFTDNIFTTDEGKSIGLGYFRERGFTDETIKKFQLGYSQRSRNAFTETAQRAGYALDILRKAGLTRNDNDDFFHDRVIFPLHNVTGRVIAFAGRTMKASGSEPKYINSPETEIYNKSNTLYGIFFAKKAIATHDECYLVEGYTDVISLHQSGIENAVASSGTSLTVEQLRLVKRYSQNLTILYDGDPAGIKASLRGIDLALEEGLNIKVVVLPDGEDPDSFAQKTSASELRSFIKERTTDFIRYKARMLMDESGKDPAKKARIIKDIVLSVALIPEPITRTVYIKECSNIINIAEEILNYEIRKERENRYRQKISRQDDLNYIPEPASAPVAFQPVSPESTEQQEREVIRILLNYGHKIIRISPLEKGVRGIDPSAESGEPGEDIPVCRMIISGIREDGIEFRNPVLAEIFRLYCGEFDRGIIPEDTFFTSHQDIDICSASVELITSRYRLSDWETKFRITIPADEENLAETTMKALHALKEKIVKKMIIDFQEKLKNSTSGDEFQDLLVHDRKLQELKKHLSTRLGRVIIK
ncbi:MAG: DNA primase [Bacteroidetes bacterium]|nr:DNA primase [Bacteroidota bacterium]